MDNGLSNLIAKAEAGDMEAMAMVGDCYSRGFHTDKDDSKAQDYYKMAADNGHIRGAFMAGLGFLLGTGVEKNKKEAVKYIQIAADKGFADAQHMMGRLYQTGMVGFMFKNQQAIKYYKMAAKQGHAAAQYELGKIYLLEWSNGNTHRFEDGLFWLVAASMHTSQRSLEISNNAKELIDNNILYKGYPGEKVKKVINKIRKDYPDYIKDAE